MAENCEKVSRKRKKSLATQTEHMRAAIAERHEPTLDTREEGDSSPSESDAYASQYYDTYDDYEDSDDYEDYDDYDDSDAFDDSFYLSPCSSEDEYHHWYDMGRPCRHIHAYTY